MIDRTSRILLLPSCLWACCFLAGCTTEYVFQFKESGSDDPLTNASIKVSSCHRIYSFLDPRHYLAETGRPVTAEGQTDSHGKVTLGLPSDLGIRYICLDNEWFAREPLSDWRPMLTRGEYEAKSTEVDLQAKPDRPLIRIDKR